MRSKPSLIYSGLMTENEDDEDAAMYVCTGQHPDSNARQNKFAVALMTFCIT